MADKIGGVAIDFSGNVLEGASVEVTDNGTGTLSSLYSDIGLTNAIANPLTTNGRGKWSAFAATGIYDVRVYTDVDEDIDTYVSVP